MAETKPLYSKDGMNYNNFYGKNDSSKIYIGKESRNSKTIYPGSGISSGSQNKPKKVLKTTGGV